MPARMARSRGVAQPGKRASLGGRERRSPRAPPVPLNSLKPTLRSERVPRGFPRFPAGRCHFVATHRCELRLALSGHGQRARSATTSRTSSASMVSGSDALTLTPGRRLAARRGAVFQAGRRRGNGVYESSEHNLRDLDHHDSRHRDRLGQEPPVSRASCSAATRPTRDFRLAVARTETGVEPYP